MSDGRDDAPRSHASAAPAATAATTLAVAAVTLLVLLLAVWAASAGPDDPLRGDGITPDRVSVETPSDTSSSPTPDEARPASDRDDGDGGSVLATVVGLLVLGIGVALVLTVLWLAGSTLWRLRKARLRRLRDPEADPPPLDPVQSVASAMVADAGEHEDLLTGGSPRNAVVLCWHRFEVQAERAGVPRKPWETSSEFTLRILELVEADAGSVARLAELYREARFSEHELGEDARAAALAIVQDIHRDLRTLLSGGRR
ncbi:DUF4129 domain-containing protein [Nocardioides sp.]|uniref:DUF4129 domain-containing protein n=1 Tax=Nocardioides sp. TaxID=35761 RepID=UPI002721E87A|nr:DUF4129 domain-containing protein [Nocardioides sp.]MDO9456154.1 DUF4129 domain-containing protein [Nocardioides sp.]